MQRTKAGAAAAQAGEGKAKATAKAAANQPSQWTWQQLQPNLTAEQTRWRQNLGAFLGREVDVPLFAPGAPALDMQKLFIEVRCELHSTSVTLFGFGSSRGPQHPICSTQPTWASLACLLHGLCTCYMCLWNFHGIPVGRHNCMHTRLQHMTWLLWAQQNPALLCVCYCCTLYTFFDFHFTTHLDRCFYFRNITHHVSNKTTHTVL